MPIDNDLEKISAMIDLRIEKHSTQCSNDLKHLLDKSDALIYGGFGLVLFAVMIKYAPMVDKDSFNRFVNIALIGLSSYAFILSKKNLEKKESKYFLIILLLVTVYLLAPKTLETIIQKLMPSFF